MSAQQPANDYVFGDCTYYVKQRFPQLSNQLGNAKDWLTNAKKHGYTLIKSPAPNTVVVYGPSKGYDSQYGHTAVVDSVNSDGTFVVSEMNYNGWNYVDQRKSTMAGVVGFFVPPGSTYVAPQNADQNNACITPGILGLGCFDATIGAVAMGAGGLIMLSGVFVITATAMKQTSIGRGSAAALGTMTRPVRGATQAIGVRRAARVSAEKTAAKTAATQSHTEAMRRAQVRTARARARASEATARKAKIAA